MAIFRIDIDDIIEDIFFELEKLSEGGESHYCDMSGHNKEDAAENLCKHLRPFFAEKFRLQKM